MAFEKQTFVVVGGSNKGSIGLSFTKQLLTNGVEKVAMLDVCDPSDAIAELKSAFPKNAVQFHKADVRNKAQIESVLKEVTKAFGRIDVLANFAGVADESRVEDTIQINLLGVINVTFCGVDLMNGRGMIVNIASAAGLDEFAASPVYCASKFGVVGFMRSMASKSLATDMGIKFVTICPGITHTSMLTNFKVAAEEPTTNAEFEKLIKMHGIQTPEECAKSLLLALKVAGNGSVYIINCGKAETVNFPKYFKNVQ